MYSVPTGAAQYCIMKAGVHQTSWDEMSSNYGHIAVVMPVGLVPQRGVRSLDGAIHLPLLSG